MRLLLDTHAFLWWAAQPEKWISMLPIELTYIHAHSQLPNHHKDPFDRMLIAQAITENIPIVTADQAFQSYPVHIIWQDR